MFPLLTVVAAAVVQPPVQVGRQLMVEAQVAVGKLAPLEQPTQVAVVVEPTVSPLALAVPAL
jgi:hypothetical protein